MAKRPPVFRTGAPRSKKRGWARPNRKSASKRGYGWEWAKLRLRILERNKWLCQPCLKRNKTTIAKEVDHIVPRANGGTDDEDNLQSICVDCHRAKTAREGYKARHRA